MNPSSKSFGPIGLSRSYFPCSGRMLRFGSLSSILLTYFLLILVPITFFPVVEGAKSEIRQTIGGVYSNNDTLRFMNGPFRVDRDIVVETGATLTIQTGTELYFDPGVGIKVHGTLYAVGVPQARIKLLPYKESDAYDGYSFPNFRLVDGPSTRQGRLEVFSQSKWRAVCTQNTNWTNTDYSMACQTMGFGGGGFWRWYRRNNDTRPFVMPKPDCKPKDTDLWSCRGFLHQSRIPLSENLCQGEDDLGLVCWGPPNFSGWEMHWKGIEFISAPYSRVWDDPNKISTNKQSLSRLEYVDILYAGYDGSSKNSTAAIRVQGMPPFINNIHVQHSARDGLRIIEPDGPVFLANSTISFNRGHGIVVDRTTDGRVFINETRVVSNYGDGIWYRQKGGTAFSLVPYSSNSDRRSRRQSPYLYEEQAPLVDICRKHTIQRNIAFPYYIGGFLQNRTEVILGAKYPCYLSFELPRRLDYTFSFQFLDFVNKNPVYLKGIIADLVICYSSRETCQEELYRIPIKNGFLPQSLALHNNGQKILVGIDYQIDPELAQAHGLDMDRVVGDVDVKLKIHATAGNRIYYGMNITNSRVEQNVGRGVFLSDVRDRIAITNATISRNQMSGILIKNGAADIWINASHIDGNMRDGINVSYAGGSTLVNGTTMIGNWLRGAAFHHNDTPPFFPLRQEIVFRGRQSNLRSFKRTVIQGNRWGGLIVGNFCSNAIYRVPHPKVILNYIEFFENQYHPAFELNSCQRSEEVVTHVDVAGSLFERNQGISMRFQPAVNVRLDLTDNRVMHNARTALIIRNKEHPQLMHLPATVSLSMNQFKFNRGPYIVNVGLNEDAPDQHMTLNTQNEIKENTVFNPYPYLKARNSPYAAMIVSSSTNVRISGNCFKNPKAQYEIATDLAEHAKTIHAEQNSWGTPDEKKFLPRIFDQYNRFNLAAFSLNPFAQVCNAQLPRSKVIQPYIRSFQNISDPFQLGGIIYENVDLRSGYYIVTDDLHIIPGARLNLQPGVTLGFEDSIGMLVQGELINTGEYFSNGNADKITFTITKKVLPQVDGIRLVGPEGNTDVTEGRLEVKVDNQWGTICNRSWNVDLAAMACHQLGLVIDPEFLQNWVTYPEAGDLPMVMDNIRCEEDEWDIQRCWHDGMNHSLTSSCNSFAVVGLRCVRPHWAGVRYSLLANPPLGAGAKSMSNWVIEKAGLFDYSLPEFSAALQIDWNYHYFEGLTIQDSFWNGLDVVYNDLTRKPSIVNSNFLRNRRHGIRLRSAGLTIRGATISENENAGVRYNPIVSARLQKDVVTWLVRPDLTQYQSPNVIDVTDATTINLDESAYSRKFLVAAPSVWCPRDPVKLCRKTITVLSTGYIGVQVVNRPSNESDENMLLRGGAEMWNLRKDLIRFPMILETNRLTIEYSRFKGQPQVVILLFYLSRVEYIDRFVHVHNSEISDNQYGISTLHYSNFTHWDGSTINRWEQEKLWFQKVNFTRNKQAVVWVNGPLRDVYSESPIAKIIYFIDNCSLTLNNGSIIETHRDLHSSANVFFWEVWSSTFRGNVQSGISIMLPDTYNLLEKESHRFKVSESRFYNNRDFEFELSGYYTKVNISSNNFTMNFARKNQGLILLRGMEKNLVMERNRWKLNRGHWIVKYDIQSQSVRSDLEVIPAHVRYNYFEENRFLDDPEKVVFSYPRSFTLGIFGIQKVNVSYNRFNNFLMDFEVVTGLKGASLRDTANITYNWWGPIAQGAIPQRIFDFDDWNIFILADYNPYYVSNEKFIDWWWKPQLAQSDTVTYLDPPVDDLKGRMFQSKTMTRNIEKWPTFPHYLKPQVPYRITKDLTIMPGATLTIEKGVMVHLYPNVRILVLGSLIAEGTFYEPIRFRPINISEYEHKTEYFLAREALRRTQPTREKRDIVYRQFPLLNRADSFYQKFKVYLVGAKAERSGFLEIYNATTGEMVPICDRQFTRRNAEVVCRELGYSTHNTYVWIGPRYDYDPKIRIVKSYSEPRQCFGTEDRLSDCDLRLNGDKDLWYCVDSEHFVFLHCGMEGSLDPKYIGHWGGIVFSSPNLDHNQALDDQSILKHVEIVGAGYAHNDSSSALELVYRSPTLENVNVTNSSMHGVQIFAPRDKVRLKNLNITDNRGTGLNVLTLNLQSSRQSAGSPLKNLSIPYHLFGMLNLCSVGKEVKVSNRILMYYKYDSYPVDCVKYFTATRGRSLRIRLLQANFYHAHDPAGRPDRLQVYNLKTFTKDFLIGVFGHNSSELDRTYQSTDVIMGIHLRANAADGKYGFVAEVAALPTAPDAAPVSEVTVRQSRFVRNDRGAVKLGTAGEKSPILIFENCYFGLNGYNVWGNFSTSEIAVAMDLHNTEEIRFISNMLWKNQGGLVIQSQSSTPTSRLQGLIKNCAFAQNQHFETLKLTGKDFQKIFVVNNYFGKNRARYRDIVLVDKIITNFTHNTFYNNTGTHTMDLTGYPEITTETQTFYGNFLYDNIALGHGYQFPARYGYLPATPSLPTLSRKKRDLEVLMDILNFRRKRQSTTSFDWWANVGADTGRYRSTVLAGSSQQHYERNFFDNPLNDFELTTVNQTEFSTSRIDARENYWGYPGTPGVAAGKIRDKEDYKHSFLVEVNYKPVLESNTSLLEGGCPGGWFQAGIDRFKTCFLFVGAAMPFSDASNFCEEQGGFIPYFRSSDSRVDEVAANIRNQLNAYVMDMEVFSPYQPTKVADVWVTGVKISSNKCGYLSSVTGTIHDLNCGLMRPFICERGGKAYQEPFLWTPAGITCLIAGIILFILILLLIFGWWWKSRVRKKEHFQRKSSLRASIRSNKMAQERLKHQDTTIKTYDEPTQPRGASPDLIAQAHRNLVIGRGGTDSSSSSPAKKDNVSNSSFNTSFSDISSSYPSEPNGKKEPNSSYYTESAYRSDYSPTTDSALSGIQTGQTFSQSSRHHVSGAPTPPVHAGRPDSQNTFTSFKLPGPAAASSVIFRNGKNKGKPRRHDTTTTMTSETTSGTCSTCPTTSYFSNDTERDSRRTDSTFSGESETGDETSTVRSSEATDDTINYAESGVFGRKPDLIAGARGRTRGPVTPLSGSNTFLEDTRDYLQPSMTPVKDWDRAAGGYTPPTHSKTKPDSNGYKPSANPEDGDSPRARPYENWAPIRGKRPQKPPPPLPGSHHGRSFPDIALAEGNDLPETIILGFPKTQTRPPGHSPENSKSMGNLDQATEEPKRPWRPPSHLPDLSSFSLTPTKAEAKPSPPRRQMESKRKESEGFIPLETAM